MALSGVHVTCAFVGIDGFEDIKPALIKGASWSESPASGTPSTNSVSQTGADGSAILRVDASADSYVSIGPAPNAAQSPRYFVRAGVTYDFGAKVGDKVAWVAA